MLPRLAAAAERERAVSLLLGYLDDESAIERTLSMQSLADLADDDALRARMLPALERLAATGTAAVRSRGRKLVEGLRQRPLLVHR